VLNATLQGAVAAAAGLSGPEQLHLVPCSSTGATGATIFHGWVDDEPDARVVVKTPRAARLHDALQREWDAVSALRADARLAGLIPAALARVACEGSEYYAYEAAPGRTMYSRYRNRVLGSRSAMLERFAAQALAVIVRVHETQTRQVSPDEIARDLLMDLAWLESSIPDFPRAVSDTGRAYANRLASAVHALPRGRVHGDFSPHNVITGGMGAMAEARLVDWEHTEAERPQHLDVFRFVSACVLLGKRGSSRPIALRDIQRRAASLLDALLRPWLDRVGAPGAGTWLEPSLLEALWWHYWTHAARRELERRASPRDCPDATYLPGLVAMSEHASPPLQCRSSAFAC
jgi:hypothetical protein